MPTLVQSQSGSIASGATLTVTLGSATTAGNCLIVCAGAAQASADPTVSGITLGGSAGNFAVVKAVNNNADADCEIWADPGCAGGQTSVVVSFNAGSGSQQGNAVWVMEWSGVTVSGPVDKVNGANASGSSFSSGSTGTLTNASELVIGAVAYFGSSSNTITGPSSPWTGLAQVNAGGGGNGVALAAGYQVVSATTSLAYSGTNSVSNGYGAVIATFTTGTAANVTGAGAQVAVQGGTGTPYGGTNAGSVTGVAAHVTVVGGAGTPAGGGVHVVNAWKATFAQPSSSGPVPPALQSLNVLLDSGSSVGGGSGTPTAGNWLFALVGWNQDDGLPAMTVGVADDIHSWWRPQPPSASSGNTRSVAWYTANLARVPTVVYVAPNAAVAGAAVLVVEVANLGPWDTVTGYETNYAGGATSLGLTLPAPT